MTTQDLKLFLSVVSGLVCLCIAVVLFRTKDQARKGTGRLDVVHRYCVDASLLNSITQGMAYSEVHRLFGGKERHQFTITRGTSDVVCVAYQIEHPFVRFYALFYDYRLQGFVEPPSFDVNLVDYNGAKLEVETPVDVHARITKTLSAERLDSATVNRRAQRLESIQAGGQNRLEPKILRLLELRTEELVEQYRVNDELKCRYDSSRIGLRTSRSDVHRLLGKPNQLKGRSGTVDIYEIQSPKDINPMFRLSGIVIEYTNASAMAIYSGDFFQSSWEK